MQKREGNDHQQTSSGAVMITREAARLCRIRSKSDTDFYFSMAHVRNIC
jgi:hypothetical protein